MKKTDNVGGSYTLDPDTGIEQLNHRTLSKSESAVKKEQEKKLIEKTEGKASGK